MKKLQSFFKMSLKQEDNKPSITEVTYKGADWNTYNWLQFEWYASTKDLDRGRDVIMPEAFRNSIEQFMENPIIFLQHDSNKAIGTIIEATIDDVWLYVKGIVKTDKDNIFQDLRTGVIKTMSFGYRITEYETIDTPDWVYRQINWLELFEVSLVSVPMNPKAKIKSKKELLEKWLNDEEYAKNFQISKNDEYTLYKSIEDLRIKSEDLVEKEEVVEGKEKIIEEKEEIKEEITEVEEENTDTEEITEVEEENTDTEEKEEENPVDTDTEEEIKEVEKENEDNVGEEEKTDEIETEKEVVEEKSLEIEEKTDEDVSIEEISEITEETESEQNIEEDKETIEEPEIPENVVWDSDKSEVEDTETPENDVEVEINEDLEKRFNQIEKSLETIEETKGLSIETKSQIELLQKDLSDLKSETKKFKEDMSVVVEWCLSKVKELYTAFKNHYIDSAMPYVEEKKPEEDVMLWTWLAKTIAKIKS